MNPFDLTASDLMIWGLVLHLIADWPLQNDWMANNKALTRMCGGRWYDRHPAAYVHAGIHGLLLAIVFGWVALLLALIHLVIDTRWPVAKWSQLVKQTQPAGHRTEIPQFDSVGNILEFPKIVPVYDVGTEVRFWTDQVFHIITIAIAALLVTL